jgi:hypothetical protein
VFWIRCWRGSLWLVLFWKGPTLVGETLMPFHQKKWAGDESERERELGRHQSKWGRQARHAAKRQSRVWSRRLTGVALHSEQEGGVLKCAGLSRRRPLCYNSRLARSPLLWLLFSFSRECFASPACLSPRALVAVWLPLHVPNSLSSRPTTIAIAPSSSFLSSPRSGISHHLPFFLLLCSPSFVSLLVVLDLGARSLPEWLIDRSLARPLALATSTASHATLLSASPLHGGSWSFPLPSHSFHGGCCCCPLPLRSVRKAGEGESGEGGMRATTAFKNSVRGGAVNIVVPIVVGFSSVWDWGSFKQISVPQLC